MMTPNIILDSKEISDIEHYCTVLYLAIYNVLLTAKSLSEALPVRATPTEKAGI